jgi:hypothetical protein
MQTLARIEVCVFFRGPRTSSKIFHRQRTCPGSELHLSLLFVIWGEDVSKNIGYEYNLSADKQCVNFNSNVDTMPCDSIRQVRILERMIRYGLPVQRRL